CRRVDTAGLTQQRQRIHHRDDLDLPSTRRRPPRLRRQSLTGCRQSRTNASSAKPCIGIGSRSGGCVPVRTAPARLAVTRQKRSSSVRDQVVSSTVSAACCSQTQHIASVRYAKSSVAAT